MPFVRGAAEAVTSCKSHISEMNNEEFIMEAYRTGYVSGATDCAGAKFGWKAAVLTSMMSTTMKIDEGRVHEGKIYKDITQLCRCLSRSEWSSLLDEYREHFFATLERLLEGNQELSDPGLLGSILSAMQVQDCPPALALLRSRHYTAKQKVEDEEWRRLNKQYKLYSDRTWGSVRKAINSYWDYANYTKDSPIQIDTINDHTKDQLEEIKEKLDRQAVGKDVLWLTANQYVEAHEKYVELLRTTHGSKIDVEEKEICIPHDMLGPDTKTGLRNNQPLRTRVLKITGKVMEELKTLYFSYGDRLLFAAEQDFEMTGTTSKGRMFRASANKRTIPDARMALYQGKLLLDAVDTDRGEEDLIRLWKRNFIDLYNEALEVVATRIQKRNPTKVVRFYRWDVNLLQTVVERGNKAYDLHTDLSFELYCPVPRAAAADNGLSSLASTMPQHYEMNVPTLVFVTRSPGREDELKKDDTAGRCHLTHHINGKVDEKSIRDDPLRHANSTFTTDHCCQHQQLGLQNYTKHKVTVVDSNADGVIRTIISGRCVADWSTMTSQLKRSYMKVYGRQNFVINTKDTSIYRWTNLYSTEGREANIGITNASNDQDHGASKASPKKKEETRVERQIRQSGKRVLGLIKQPPKLEAKREEIPQPFMSMAADGTSLSTMRSRDMVRKLVEHQMYLRWDKPYTMKDVGKMKESLSARAKRLEISIDEARHQLCHNADNTPKIKSFDFLKPSKYMVGKLYDADTIYRDNHISPGTHYSADVCNRSLDHPDVVILKEKTKNGFHWMNPIVDAMFPKGIPLDDEDTRPVHPEVVYQFKSGTMFPIGPMGGNNGMSSAAPSEAGQGDKKSAVGKADATVRIDGYKQFKFGVRNKTVVTLFVPASWFSPDHANAKDDRVKTKLVCMGMWYYNQHEHTTNVERCGALSPSNYEERKTYSHYLYDPNDLENTRWARPEADNPIYLLAPLFDLKNPMPPHVTKEDSNSAAKPFRISGREIIAKRCKDHTELSSTNHEHIVKEWVDSEIARRLGNGYDDKKDAIPDVVLSRKHTVTTDDFARQSARIGISNFARYLQENVLHDQGNRVGYLYKDDYDRLSEVLMSRYVEHPNRCMSVVVLGLLMDLCVVGDDGFEPLDLKNIDGVRERMNKLREVIFKAVVMRSVPFTPVYILYNRWKEHASSFELMECDDSLRDAILASLETPITSTDAVLIPCPDDVEDFVKFLSFLAGGKEGPMAPFTKVLHKDSLLSNVRSTVEVFEGFLKSFRTDLCNLFASAEDGSLLTLSRDEWQKKLIDLLNDDSQKGDVRFIVACVLLDIQDVVADVYAESDTEFVTLGAGGKRCLKLLDLEILTDNSAPSSVEESQALHRRVCQLILDHLRTKTEKDILHCLGFQLRDCNLVNMVNNLPVSIHHMDHLLCKVSYNESLTTGNRLGNKSASLFQVYGWPLNASVSDVFALRFLQKIAREAIVNLAKYKKTPVFGKMSKCFLFEGEDARLEKIKSGMKAVIARLGRESGNRSEQPSGQKRKSSKSRSSRSSPVKRHRANPCHEEEEASKDKDDDDNALWNSDDEEDDDMNASDHWEEDDVDAPWNAEAQDDDADSYGDSEGGGYYSAAATF